MDYKRIYTENYFTGKDCFFYALGYGRFQKLYFRNLFRPLRLYLKKIKRGKVLDVGCAYGFMLRRFPQTFEKFGIDISEHAIKRARKRLPEGAFKVGGAEDVLPFPENFFDIVICNDVVEHLENPQVALENMRKVLKIGGILYINTPNLNWLRRKIFSYPDKKEYHISLLSHKLLFNLLDEAGFDIIKHWTYTSIFFFFFIKFRGNIGHESAFVCKKI